MSIRKLHRPAFTLVEVLIVIAIIGILIGLLVPGVMMAMRTVQAGAITAETRTLTGKIEEYNTKVGEYPPDGSNTARLTTHLRKRWPEIASTEIALVTSATMDRAEALVFFLGGFSDNPVYPISGVGGPVFIMNSAGAQINSGAPVSARASIQYNTDRNLGFHEFEQDRLTLGVVGGLTVSVDESTYFGGTNDLLPVYHPSGKQAPYVYFDSRTYTTGGVYGTAAAPFGVARPYMSDIPNTKAAVNTLRYFKFMGNFQIVSAGLDDNFGGYTGTGMMFHRYPSGDSVSFSSWPVSATATAAVGNSNQFKIDHDPSFQTDNACSFAERTLGDDMAGAE